MTEPIRVFPPTIRYSHPADPGAWPVAPHVLDLGSPIRTLWSKPQTGALSVETDAGWFHFSADDFVGTPPRLRGRERLRVQVLVWLRRLDAWVVRL